nr:unnamed protein product [Callosobruchus analis]
MAKIKPARPVELIPGVKAPDYSFTSGDFGSWIILWPRFGSKTDKCSYRHSAWKISQNDVRTLDITYWLCLLVSISKERRVCVQNLDDLFISTRGKVCPASRAKDSRKFSVCNIYTHPRFSDNRCKCTSPTVAMESVISIR